MKTQQFPQWKRTRVLSAFEYPQHAGLSTDGRLCFLAEYDNLECLVWDISNERVIWRADSPDLKSWIEDGHIEIKEGPAKGRYRIFGLHYNYPLETKQELGIALRLDEENDLLVLSEIATNQTIQSLKYESSTDWAFASFCDEGAIIAVLVTHDVTFFDIVKDAS